MKKLPASHPERLLSVYYDGSCPLCQREIAFYRRRVLNDRIKWIDVSEPADLGSDLSCSTAMSRFHVRDSAGHLYSGGLAFAMLWLQIPGWRWLGAIFSRAPFSLFIEWAYRAFLPVRPKLKKLFR